jgi:hypothetical protein
LHFCGAKKSSSNFGVIDAGTNTNGRERITIVKTQTGEILTAQKRLDMQKFNILAIYLSLIYTILQNRNFMTEQANFQ